MNDMNWNIRLHILVLFSLYLYFFRLIDYSKDKEHKLEQDNSNITKQTSRSN